METKARQHHSTDANQSVDELIIVTNYCYDSYRVVYSLSLSLLLIYIYLYTHMIEFTI